MSYSFDNLIIICISEDYFMFNLFDILWASRIWIFNSLPGFGKFSVISSLKKFSAPFSLPIPSGTLIMCVFIVFIVSHKSLRFLHSLLFFFYVLFFWLDFKWSVFEFTYSLFCYSRMVLEISIEFFSIVIVFFSAGVSIWVFFMVSIS